VRTTRSLYTRSSGFASDSIHQSRDHEPRGGRRAMKWITSSAQNERPSATRPSDAQCAGNGRAPLCKTSARVSEKVPGCESRISVGHGVSLLQRRRGGRTTPTMRPPYPSSRHELSRIAPVAVDVRSSYSRLSVTIDIPVPDRSIIPDRLMGTSNNTRFQRFLSWLSGRLQRSCRGESPIGDRFDAWPASVLCTMPHGLHP